MKKEDENVSDDDKLVMETANPSERAAAGVDEGAARWRGFSDEELDALRRAISRAALSETDSLSNEISEVQHRREAERSSYRGPGRYRHCRGGVFEVLGGVSVHEQVILRELGAAPGLLLVEKMTDFEDRDYDGSRLYEYLGPLEGEIS